MAGGMALPYATGHLAASSSLPLALLLVPAAFAAFALLTRSLAGRIPPDSARPTSANISGQ